jgi:ribosomal protein S7
MEIQFTFTNHLYCSFWIEKLLKLLQIKGKKETAEVFICGLLKYFKLQFGIYPYFIFNDFILKNKIAVEIRSYRKSNIFYDVPFPVEISRQYKKNLH